MYPILSAAKISDKYNRAYLNGDVLRINGIDYTVDDPVSLPEDLHPSKFSLKENDNCMSMCVWVGGGWRWCLMAHRLILNQFSAGSLILQYVYASVFSNRC